MDGLCIAASESRIWGLVTKFERLRSADGQGGQ